MRALFVKLVLIAAMVAATVGAVLLAPVPRASYVDAVIDKQHRLETLPPGKLVLVGGSNLAFGTDTPGLAAALHRPAVNMGLHGDVGIRFMLQQVRPSIAAGDLIVVSPEYENFFKHAESSRMLCRVISYVPKPWRFVSWTECARCLVLSAEDRFQRNAEWLTRRAVRLHPREFDDIYVRRGFDSFGDMHQHLGRPSTFKAASLPQTSTFHEIDRQAIDVLRDFGRMALRRGASVVLVYPVYAQAAYEIDREAIGRLDRALRVQLPPAVKIMGRPEDFVLPTQDFFDTKYHTNAQGRALRTSRLAELLGQYRAR